MTGFPDAPLIGPSSELQLTIDDGAAAHEEAVAEALLEPAAAVADVGGLEVGEEAEALELDLAPGSGRYARSRSLITGLPPRISRRTGRPQRSPRRPTRLRWSTYA
jgi:hypothetical protein